MLSNRHNTSTYMFTFYPNLHANFYVSSFYNSRDLDLLTDIHDQEYILCALCHNKITIAQSYFFHFWPYKGIQIIKYFQKLKINHKPHSEIICKYLSTTINLMQVQVTM